METNKLLKTDLDPELIEHQERYYDSLKTDALRLNLTREIHNHDGFSTYVKSLYNPQKKVDGNLVSSLQTAYELAEALYFVIFGERKYKSFDSYRNFKYQRENPDKVKKKCNNVT